MTTEADGRPINIEARPALRASRRRLRRTVPELHRPGVVAEMSCLCTSGQTYTQGKGDYDYLLPNFDFSIDLTDTVVAAHH